MIRIGLLIIIFAACIGCGQGHSTLNANVADSIVLMAISVSRTPVKAGVPVQLSIEVTFNTGEKISGLTTAFVNPTSGETVPIEWSTSNRNIAIVDAKARLIPRAPGFVTVSAAIDETVRELTVRVDGAPTPSSAVSSGDGDEDGESTAGGDESADTSAKPPEETIAPSSCQGHAVSVVSFSPGAGAGFGATSFPDIVLGPPHGAGDMRGSTHVLSLGIHGEIVLDMAPCVLVDDEGVDLIVFENAFLIGGDPTRPYAEDLGVVGVSEDGVNYFEFSCDDSGFPYTGCAGWNPVYSSISNEISPFDVINAGGDLFDLADINIESARYVRIRDLDGSGGGGAAGFDLDAISVVNGIREVP